MAEPTDSGIPAEGAPAALEGGAYDLIKQRLNDHGGRLRAEKNSLDAQRLEIFGSRKLELKDSGSIHTKLHCEPRDMVPLGSNQFLFGFNVQLSLKRGQPGDVFAIYNFDETEGTFSEADLSAIQDPGFENAFGRLFQINQDATLHRLSIVGPHLYMVFRTGIKIDDITVFKWLCQEGKLSFIDDRSSSEYLEKAFPNQYNFEWRTPPRHAIRHGDNPHVSIEDRVFVECVGGDLTIKIEDNTSTGEGIYAEEVENQHQKVDEAKIQYAIQGSLILLKIQPHREDTVRYFIFNEKLHSVHRVDTLGQACVMLPQEHGLIFPDGYYLQTGELKRFEADGGGMVLERIVESPNGEDFLYVFFNRINGLYALMPYRLIEQEVTERISCSGFSLFANGDILSFLAAKEAINHHMLQLHQSPFYQPSNQPESGNKDSYLFSVGNKTVVKTLAEINEVLILIQKESPYADLYADIAIKAQGIPDNNAWLKSSEGEKATAILKEIAGTAEKAVAEFDKVRRLRLEAREKTDDIVSRAKTLFGQVSRADMRSVDDFVANLGGVRNMRGEIRALLENRFIDKGAMEALEAQVAEQADRLSKKCVDFLLQPDSLNPYRDRAEEQRGRVDGVETVAQGKELQEEIVTAGSDLEMLIDIVRNLKIDDTTEQTRIVEAITAIYQVVNQVKEALKNKMRTLMTAEGAAQFNAQILLLSQGAVNYLDMSDSPEKCDGYFTDILSQLEDLGGKFADFPEYIEQLDQKRSELETAFEQKRLQLEEERNRKATAWVSSAERMLKSIEHKLGTFEDVNDINGYMAGDPMIASIHERVEQLQDLEKAGEAEGILSQLKSVHEEAVRQLKDKQELYVDGQNIIRFGKHKFAVNAQPLDMTMVRRGEDQFLHLTGTQYFDEVENEAFLATREVWNQTVVSEDTEIYRAEYLAYLLWQQLEKEGIDRMTEVAAMDSEARLKVVQDFMGERYAEAYTKGIHDQDAEKILTALLNTQAALQLARYYPRARACAAVFWNKFCDPDAAKMMLARLEGFATRNEIFPGDPTQADYVAELRAMVEAFIEETGLFPPEDGSPAGEYLFYEHTNGRDWVVSQEADSLLTEFERHLVQKGREADFAKAQKPLEKDPHSHYQLIRDWVRGFLLDRNGANKYLEEVAGLVFCGHLHKQAVVQAATEQVLEGIQGAHDAVEEGGNYRFDYLTFQEKLGRFSRESVPRFEAFQNLKQSLIEEEKEALRLHEFEPRVLSSFVRNQLVDEVYLPIVGDNLAKQIGAAGDAKRTDLMGLLLLISPPGYGKTTLMEYLANRMGLIFMKINGPALGHEVTSLDPEEAPNAGAREEVKKLNLSLEMGDNVMIYVDDIQHCHPEFLQKFISLCDAQRKIEGVWRGQPKTYDMRGRRVVVVMAGNPYTESGEKFRIPDMLANRADTYNLGDDMKGREVAFSGSYIENAITSNPALQPLAKAAQKDIQAFIRMAETDQREGIELQGSFSANEQEELINVVKKLITLRDVVLKVNQLYIESAGQADEFRTEPAFKMQGSYRNMNRLAEKVLPMMNEQELMDLVLDHYKGESQTLTTGAEANFLKFKQLIGVMTDEEAERWEEIKSTFGRNQYLQGGDQNDPVSRVVNQLSLFSNGLDSIQNTLKQGLTMDRPTTVDTSGLSADLENLRQTVAEGLSRTPAPAEGATASAADSGAVTGHIAQLQGALEKSLEYSGSIASASQDNQNMVMERQQAMMNFMSESNQTLLQAILQSQEKAQSSQMQATMSNMVQLLSASHQRHRELQEKLAAAQPSEVVVDVSKEMMADSDELVQNLLAQLDAIQGRKQETPPAAPQE